MKRFVLITILVSALVSCERNGGEIIVPHEPKALVSIQVDWSLFEMETVTGMSVYCYPRSGGSPFIVKTNSIDGVLLNLPEGMYDFIVINQSEEEFGKIEFEGMDSFSTASALPVTYKVPWKTDLNTMYDSEWLAIDSYEGLVITPEMTEMSEDVPDGVSAACTLTLHPENVTYRAHIAIGIHNIDKAYLVRGILSSLAGGIRLCDGDVSTFTPLYKSMDKWKCTLSENQSDGILSCDFVCFGTARTVQEHRDNRLELSFLLVDLATVSSFQYEIGEYLEVDECSKSIIIVIGASEIEAEPEGMNCNPLAPLLLPEDIESATTGSGFDVDIEDWGDVIDIKVPVI